MACQTPFRDDSAQVLLFKIASCLAEGGGLGAFGVASFNGRVGIVTLLPSDVTGVVDDIYVNETGDSMTGALAIDNGPQVASTPYLNLAQTWNNGAVTFTGLQSNITNTASSTNSNLFNFQVDGVDRFNFTPGGSFRVVRQDASDSGMNLFLRKRGNAGSATGAVANDSTIGTVNYSGWDGAAFATGSRISGLASEAWTGIAHGSRIDLYTTPVGSVTEQLTLRLSQSGQAQFLDGTAALPALTFQSSPATGIYRPAANELGFSTAGIDRIRVLSTGLTGIGTIAPKSRLHIVTGGASITLRMAQVETDATGKLGLFAVDHYTNAEEPMGIFYAETNVADNRLNIGGGRSTVNAATDIFFFTATNTTTTTGTSRMSLNSTDFTLNAAIRLAILSGANQRAGDAVLVAGTVTVANTTVTANTRVFLTRKVSGGTIGFAVTYTLIAATSFTITSDSALDTSTYSYLLIEVP